MKKCIWLILILFPWMPQFASAQRTAPELPQRTVTVSVVQELDFGQIIMPDNTARQVKINLDGIRTMPGLVAYPGDSYQQARLSFKLCPGRSITINYSTSNELQHTESSTQMNFTIDRIKIGATTLTAPGQSFFSNKGCNETHIMELETTLNLTGAHFAQPGFYQGSFNITVAYE